MEKAKNQYAIDSGVESTKAEALKGIGIPQRTAERFEQLAKHPDIVEQIIDSAEHVTKTAFVRSELALKLKPVIQAEAKKNIHQGQKPLQNSVNPMNTQKQLASIAGVSHDTIHKVEVTAGPGAGKKCRPFDPDRTSHRPRANFQIKAAANFDGETAAQLTRRQPTAARSHTNHITSGQKGQCADT